jgi:UDP-GlcNAc:undecaprenyl-phosphate GlcNAc-1-phosphate transferase
LKTENIDLVIFFTGGILLSLIINQLLLSFSQNLGIRNKNDVVIRWSSQSKPSLGGISMFAVFIFAVLAFAILYTELDLFANTKFLGLLLAASLAFAVGLADDAYDTKPLIKLGAQISCGLVLVYSGTVIDLFHIPAFDAALTVAWVVVIMNSLNMLDNMDGITATTSLFILTACMFSYFIFNGFEIDFWIVLLMAELGALIGFLKFNIHPSKMFMGDTGSQFIALFVAFFAIEGLWNTSSSMEVPAWSGLLAVLITFTPAAVDTLTVIINRIKKGQSPMVGGKDHTTHHLVYKGFNDFKVWIIFLVLNFLSAILGIFVIYQIAKGQFEWSLIGIPYFLIVFYYLYRNTLRYFPEPK